MSRLSVTIDTALVEEARQALGTRTNRDTIIRALEEAIGRRQRQAIMSHLGSLDLDFTREDVLRNRETP